MNVRCQIWVAIEDRNLFTTTTARQRSPSSNIFRSDFDPCGCYILTPMRTWRISSLEVIAMVDVSDTRGTMGTEILRSKLTFLSLMVIYTSKISLIGFTLSRTSSITPKSLRKNRSKLMLIS